MNDKIINTLLIYQCILSTLKILLFNQSILFLISKTEIYLHKINKKLKKY